MSLSPVCTVNSGATPADVAAGATVSGALANSAGVVFWSVTCISTDELNTAAAVNATLTINQSAKTFSFTAPSGLGSKVRFLSQVGITGLGLDANGVPQPSYQTTFVVNVPTAKGMRVLALDEEFEQDSKFGWINEVNAAIRTSGGVGAGMGPSATITPPPNVSGWTWVNQQSSTFANAANGLVLTTTYGGTVGPGALVHAGSGSSTMSVAGGYVWTGTGTTNTSNSYLGFGIAMYRSATSQWAVFTLIEQWNPANGGPEAWIPYYNVSYGTGASSGTHANYYSASRVGSYAFMRIRMTGTLSSSPVVFESTQDNVTWSQLPNSFTLSTLFGGSAPDMVGFGFYVPNNTGMTGSQNATYYHYAET